MKKFVLIILILLLSLSAFAQQSQQKKRIIDDAGLLNEVVVSELENRAEKIADLYNIDLVIVTKTSINGTDLFAYADDYFDNNGYGFGEDADGCLLLQVTENRDYVFSTTGRAIKILDENNYAFNKLEKDVVSNLRNNDTAGAYRAYFNTWEKFLALEAKGLTYNFFQVWNFVLITIIWVLAFIIGFYYINIWKKGMKIFLPAKQADSYVVAKSLSFSNTKDTFLYSTVSKVSKAAGSAKSSLSGGGLRTGSSGRVHGGRSGKY